MRKIILAAVMALAVAGCSSSSVQKVQVATANFNANVAAVNGSIAAVSPVVAARCADVQKYAMLIVPFVPNSGKALKYVNAANAAINAYCADVPVDIASTASAVGRAVVAAKAGYDDVTAGK